MHEVEIQDGAAKMFYVGETPWHGLGTPLEKAPTSAEAIKCAGLDWKVEQKPLFMPDSVDEAGNPSNAKQWERVSHVANVRSTDGKVLGVVGPTWTPLQNAEAFSFFDAFVSAGQASYETAGALHGGSRVWVLALLSGDPLVITGDDVVKKYLLLSNSHDGTLAARVGFTPVRVVCQNTLSAAIGDKASKLVKITHHRKIAEALAAVADVMNVVNATFEATADQYRALAAKGCSDADLQKYVNLVFSAKRVKKVTKAKNAEFPTMDELLGQVREEASEIDVAGELKSNVLPRIQQLFESGRGADLPGVRGTLWGAYNAINEYIVHDRGTDAAKRLDSTWFGGGAVQNERALKVGYAMATAA